MNLLQVTNTLKRINTLLDKGFRFECMCGKAHKTSASARHCTSCATYCQNRMMRRETPLDLQKLSNKYTNMV